ncbi:LacI family DNA-binding transcriptional regulator [Marinovum sp.]|uniref:LacI family DNA-binding transcriptional regulator n=1 Tax=Marinovum sp. TaxID=2024839 RepID=UPI002B272CD9|nr:LacI family DNA-binding transcriptional regulator [Marinovum sp.]
MATVRDVAKIASVSTSTVSLALSGSDKVSAKTRQRIWDAAKTVGYVPNPVAQSLARGHSDMIGMVIGDVSNPFIARFFKEVERISLKRGHMVIVSDTDTDPARELGILRHLKAQHVAGVLFTPYGNSPEYVEAVQEFKLPMVVLDHKIGPIDADFVATDHELASAMLTEHVIRLGHRRIAHIAGNRGLYSAEQRLAGFRKTIAKAGLQVDEDLILYGEYDGDRAYECTMRLLTRPDRPTAIITANNMMGLGALKATMDLGVACPDEVSLATIDDVPWGDVIRPRMTMAVQPIADIARVSMEFLLERIKRRNELPIQPREHLFVPQLVIGQSCARLG